MTTPKDAEVPSTTATPLQPPTPVVASFWMLITSAALWSFIVVTTLVSWNSEVDILLQQPRPSNVTRNQALSTIHEYLIVNLALDVVFALLYVLFAFMVRAGRNWARLSITAVVALFAIFGILSGATLYSLIIVLIGLVAVGLLYLRRSKEFFAAVKAATPSRFRFRR
ncbi:MAG TPA: hypothetical protein VEO01_25905 [Pseudonocardiaceae bacterium]|nr:hypothetical protein [Pseudonocardiaceae bacterium]